MSTEPRRDVLVPGQGFNELIDGSASVFRCHTILGAARGTRSPSRMLGLNVSDNGVRLVLRADQGSTFRASHLAHGYQTSAVIMQLALCPWLKSYDVPLGQNHLLCSFVPFSVMRGVPVAVSV